MEKITSKFARKIGVAILYGFVFMFLGIFSAVSTSSGNNLWDVIFKGSNSNKIYYVISLIIGFFIVIASIISLIFLIKENKNSFFGVSSLNIFLIFVLLILGIHFSLWSIIGVILLIFAILTNLLIFIYFILCAKYHYEDTFYIGLDSQNEVDDINNIKDESSTSDENNNIDSSTDSNENDMSNEENVNDESMNEADTNEENDANSNENNTDEVESEESNSSDNEENDGENSNENDSVNDEELDDEDEEDNKNSKNKSNKSYTRKNKKTVLFAKENPYEYQELTPEDLEVNKLKKDVTNDIYKSADENGVSMGVAKEKDFKKLFITLIISIVAFVASLFIPIYIENGSEMLIPIQEFSEARNNYTFALIIVFFGMFLFVISYFTYLLIRRSEREDLGLRIIRLTNIIFAFSIIYFIFGLIYFFVNVLVNKKDGLTLSFIFPTIMAAILVANAIIKSKYVKDVLFIEKNSSDVDFVSANDEEPEIKSFKRPFPSIELLVYSILFTILPVSVLFVTMFDVYIDGNLYQSIKAIDYITKMSTFTNTGYLAISFLLLIFGAVLVVFFLLNLVTFFTKQRKFYSFAASSIAISTVMIASISCYGLYFKIVQAANKEQIIDLIGQFAPGEVITAIDSYSVSTYSYIVFLIAFVFLLYIIARNPMKNVLVYDEIDDKDLFEARLNASPVNGETIGDYIKDRMPKNNNDENNDKPNEESATPVLPSPNTAAVQEDEGEDKLPNFDACPVFTEIDAKKPIFDAELANRKKTEFETLDLCKLTKFIIEYAANSRLHLSYKFEDIAAFIAGLGCTRLTILQGMSGTGKTSLPKIFMEAIYGNCELIEIESSWREKNELLGFYNEFSKMYTPKKFTQCLYKATLNNEVITFIVLDEMNLSRIEYYFSDFLSLMENEEDKREVRLSNVKLFNTFDNEKHSYLMLKEDHTLKVPSNVWFIGTANRDESTFEISDKVYDRAHTMNFNKRAPAITKYGSPLKPKFLTYKKFRSLLENAKKTYKFDIEKNETIKKVEQLLSPFNISFGNRIYKQIIEFVQVYCSCFPNPKAVEFDAVETILLTKVVMKLENKNVENKDLLIHEFERLKLKRCVEFLSKLSED